MADDTRQPSADVPTDEEPQTNVRPIRRPPPKHDFPKSQAGKMWDAFGNPDQPINTMPGGTYNSAGGKPKEVSWKDAFNFSYEGRGPSWYQTPCARDSLMVGIGGGRSHSSRAFLRQKVCKFRRRGLYHHFRCNVLLV
jgi:cytochrome c oxidase assembly protein subunit 20